MKLWRVSNYLDLSGQGGRLYQARWHHAGRPILYTAEHSALALLESLVHLETDGDAPSYQLIELSAPDGLALTEFHDTLPPESNEYSQNWGDRWLAEEKTALASVPSVIAPNARNLLVNPSHPDAQQVTIVRHARYRWDPRLFERA